MMYPNPWFASSGDLVLASLIYGEAQATTVLDISEPASPVEVSRFGTTGYLGYLDIDGTMGYISDIFNGFHVIDLSDPPQATELGRPHGLLEFRDIAARGDYVYGVDINHGLFTYRVANPANPESLNCWPDYGYFHPGVITVVGDYAYVGPYEGPSRTWIFSLADPEAPALVDSVDFAFAGILYDGYLHDIASREFRVISLADPIHPQVIGSCALPFYLGGIARGIAFASDYAYVAYNVGGVQIINIANPTNPTLVGSIPGSYVLGVAASGNTMAYYQYPVSYQQAMIYVTDLTDPVHPQQVGHYNIIEQMEDMEIIGSYLLTVSPSKLAVYQVDALCGVRTPEVTPHEFVLYPCYPNPFNPSTVIRFSLPNTGHAKLTVYDVTGRQVKVLTNEVLNAGEHCVTFDGSALSSGVYFVRLEAGHHVQTEKMVLLK
jgi:hypothetical protein